MNKEYGVGQPEATPLSGFEVREVVIGGSRLRAYVAGSGSPLVLVHGLGGAAANWSSLAPLLAGRHRVLLPDLPGHGRSAPVLAPEGLGSLADTVIELAGEAGMLPATFVGNSMGADIAIQVALRRPDVVGAVVAVSAGALASSRPLARAWLRAWGTLRLSWLGGRYRLAISQRPKLRRLAFGGWGAVDPVSLPPLAALGFLDGLTHAQDTASAREALIADEPRLKLGGIGRKVLVIWGARDRTTPLDDGFEYARRLRAPLRVVAGTGHLVIAERPEECAALIERFLDG